MPSSEANKQKHVWKFSRAGGLDQVKIESGIDLLNLEKLDQKLWMALSCPTRGLEFDTKTLDFIDTDKDGRIRAPEVLAAVRWATALLKNPDILLKGSDNLQLSEINTSTDSGKHLFAAARQILTNHGKPNADSISIADLGNTEVAFAHTWFTKDGVLRAENVADKAVKQLILDIQSVLPEKPVVAKPAGLPADKQLVGITLEDIDTFFKEAQDYADWWQDAMQQPKGTPTILIFGAETTEAWEALKAVRTKIDDYFTRCRLAAFDPRATTPLNTAEAGFTALAGKNLASENQEIASLPLARIEANRPLPLTEGINPGWQVAIDKFRIATLTQAFYAQKATLSQTEWADLIERFAPYQAWENVKKGIMVEKLGLARIQQILTGQGRATLEKMIAQDKEAAPALLEMANVEKLLCFNHNLYRLLNNFVCFADFYAKNRMAVFQAGTLYIDGRCCHLCVKVENAETHSTMANLGRTYIAYCDLTHPSTKDKMTIAAIFTEGDSEKLRVGRNGIFYDRNGLDWDATIIKTIEHPISIRQAFWSPYKRIGRMISEQVEKMATDREKIVMDKASQRIEKTATTATSGKPIEKSKIDTGTLAAIGLIMSSLIGALSVVFAGFLGLLQQPHAWLKVPMIFAAAILAVSGPSMVITWLRLRRRDLAPVLDGCGWAINGRVKLNMALGHVLTETAVVPRNAPRSLEDLYPDDHIPRWVWYVVGATAIFLILFFTNFMGFEHWIYQHVWLNHLQSIWNFLWPIPDKPPVLPGGTNAPGTNIVSTNATTLQNLLPSLQKTLTNH